MYTVLMEQVINVVCEVLCGSNCVAVQPYITEKKKKTNLSLFMSLQSSLFPLLIAVV